MAANFSSHFFYFNLSQPILSFENCGIKFSSSFYQILKQAISYF